MVYYEPRVTQADKDYITLRLSQWAAQTYAAAQSYKKQKQTRRYLATQKHMTLCEHPPLVKPPVVGI